MRIVVVSVFAAAALASGVRAQEPVTPREGSFTARWVITGQWRGLGMGRAREALVADLGGRLDVAPGSAGGVIVDLASRCLVLWDTALGGSGRCSLRHPSGDEIFAEVEGDVLLGGKPVTARFVGGTGRYEGIAGGFTFARWDSFLLDREERGEQKPDAGGRSLSAFTNHVTGSWRFPRR